MNSLHATVIIVMGALFVSIWLSVVLQPTHIESRYEAIGDCIRATDQIEECVNAIQ